MLFAPVRVTCGPFAPAGLGRPGAEPGGSSKPRAALRVRVAKPTPAPATGASAFHAPRAEAGDVPAPDLPNFPATIKHLHRPPAPRPAPSPPNPNNPGAQLPTNETTAPSHQTSTVHSGWTAARLAVIRAKSATDVGTRAAVPGPRRS